MKLDASKNLLALLIALAACATSVIFVRTHAAPGHLDLVVAQTMDMSSIDVPRGASRVEVTAVRSGALPQMISRPGVVVAENVEEIAARVAGRIVSIPVYPGDVVAPGQVVARLDRAELTSQADQDAASLQQAQATAASAQSAVAAEKIALVDAGYREQMARNAAIEARASADAAVLDVQNAQIEQTVNAQTLTLAQRSYDTHRSTTNAMRVMTSQEKTRSQATFDEGKVKITQAEDLRTVALAKAVEAGWAAKSSENNAEGAAEALATSVHQSAAAEAEVTEARARANASKIVEGYATMTALAGGMVTERLAALGTLVEPGAVLLRIQQIDRVRLQAQFPESELAGIDLGSPVQVGLPDGRSIRAKVTAIYPSSDSQAHAAVVEAMVDNPHHALLPGALISMSISGMGSATVEEMGSHSGGLVPAGAIVDNGGEAGVWVAGSGRAGSGGASSIWYRCPRCGMIVDQANAVGDHDRCPMDGTVLVRVAGSTAGTVAHFVVVASGRSDGVWTEISSASLPVGTQVVTKGMDGLSEGDRLDIERKTPPLLVAGGRIP